MSVIDELITDRTQADITGRVPGRCAADYNTLNRVEQACAYIAHEIFHLFVMGGSFCHVVVMFLLL